MQKPLYALAAVAVLALGAATAAPGLGAEVYDAEVEQGELEFEAIYGTLAGGPEDGEDALVLEGAYGVTDSFRLGVQAYGQLGTFDHFLPRAEHFVGPVARFEIEGLGPELEIEAGYLFAVGAARNETDGQPRLMVELEF